MALIHPVRPPSQWADAQREWSRRLGSHEPPSQTVWGWWWTNEATEVPSYGGAAMAPFAIALGMVALVRRLRRGPAGAFVALAVHGDEDGGRAPDLVVEVRPGTLPSRDGAAEVRVLGEVAPNGALAIELGRRLLFPIAPPKVPSPEQRRAVERRSAPGAGRAPA